jgi:tetratricopeptide (TPR) repeat protein
MVKKRITRKQLLKEPDEFITFTGRLIQFVTQYRTHISISAGTLFVLLVAFSGSQYYLSKSEDKAFDLLGKAMRGYEMVFKDSGPNKALRDVEGDFQRIIDKYSGRYGGKFARKVFADICYHGGAYDRAISLYAQALEDFDDEPSVKSLILNGLGYSHESKKEYAAAASYFDRVVSEPGSILKEEALFHAGWLYEKMGLESKSREAFQTLLGEYPESLYVEMVKEKIAG